jgi:hypothetical protein
MAYTSMSAIQTAIPFWISPPEIQASARVISRERAVPQKWCVRCCCTAGDLLLLDNVPQVRLSSPVLLLIQYSLPRPVPAHVWEG